LTGHRLPLVALSLLCLGSAAPSEPWQPSPETTVICKLWGLLDGSDCHGDNLGDAKGPIDGSGLADWWDDGGFFRDFAKCSDLSCLDDWAHDWFKDNKDQAADFFGAGDPHMTGLQGQAFDLLAVGDFLYTDFGTGRDRVQLQARHTGSPGAAYIGGLAFQFGEGEESRLLEIYAGAPRVVIDGVTRDLPTDTITLLWDSEGLLAAVVRSGEDYSVMHMDGHMVLVTWSRSSLAVQGAVQLGAGTEFTGALGSSLGLEFADGTPVPQVVPWSDWTRFMSEWSVSEQSLFTVGSALPFEAPAAKPSLEDFSADLLDPLRPEAERLVGKASQWTLDSCLYDLALMGGVSRWASKTCRMLPRWPGSVIEVTE
jgi:hypothetical protein